MKRLPLAWVVAMLVLAGLGTVRSDVDLGAQETTTPAAGAGQRSESERLLTEITDSQRSQDALLVELANAQATERAETVATMSALENQLAAAQATSAARATEVAALQTQVADIESGQAGSTAPTTAVEVGMNEIAHAGPWDIMVTGVQRGTAIEGAGEGGEPAEATGVFLLVELEIVNAGTDAQTYDPYWFRITDDRGRSWTMNFSLTDTLALSGVGARHYSALQPGLPETAVVVFDIAADATGLTLRAVEDMGATSEPRPDPFVIRLEE